MLAEAKIIACTKMHPKQIRLLVGYVARVGKHAMKSTSEMEGEGVKNLEMKLTAIKLFFPFYKSQSKKNSGNVSENSTIFRLSDLLFCCSNPQFLFNQKPKKIISYYN